MKAQVFLWVGFLLVLSACDQHTERDILAVGNKKRDPATFNVRAPRAEDAAPDSREGNAGTIKKNKPVTLICDRIEQAIQLPSLQDPCVITVDQLSAGKYSLRRVDIEIKQVETKEVLRFSREAKQVGKFQTEDVMRRDVLWGASNEVVADLNLAWNFWKTESGLKFDQRIHHTVVFDRLKQRVISKTLDDSTELGARMYELFTQAPVQDPKSKSISKLMAGEVTHLDATIFEPNTNHAVRIDHPYAIKGQGVVRKVGKDNSVIQLIVIYQRAGGNDLNYLHGVAYEYVLVEAMGQFKGLAGN